jgi:hypothetical protein
MILIVWWIPRTFLNIYICWFIFWALISFLDLYSHSVDLILFGILFICLCVCVCYVWISWYLSETAYSRRVVIIYVHMVVYIPSLWEIYQSVAVDPYPVIGVPNLICYRSPLINWFLRIFWKFMKWCEFCITCFMISMFEA